MSSPRRIVIAGGTGFLGAPLARAFAAAGASVAILTRRPGQTLTPPATAVPWNPDGTAGPWAAAIDGADAVINLAGESIGGRRWSARQKARIVDSRILATRSLVAAIGGAHVPPPVFVSSSGIGYYGPHADEILTEQAPPGDDFIARLGVAWEAEAQRAASPRTRVVCVRTSLVTGAGGGALAQMLLPFRLGIGGRIGSGQQYWAWIHRDDWVAMIVWAVWAKGLNGGLNVTAPNPVTNAEFTRALARALRRPAPIPVPGFAVRLLLGEMADALLLSGQRAVPDKALRGGFRFRYETIDDAFSAIFGGSAAA